MLLKALRYGLYAQLLLGLGRMFGMIPNERIWDIHVGIGIVVVVLGVLALRPLPGMSADTMRVIARFAPLVTFAVGFGMMVGMIPGRSFVMIHMLLGIITIGLVEMSAGRQRRMFGDDVAPT